MNVLVVHVCTDQLHDWLLAHGRTLSRELMWAIVL